MDMQQKVKDLRELMRLREELEAEITAAQDEIKAQMKADKVYEYRGTDYKVSWAEITSSRIDTAAFKKALPDLAAKYTKTTTTRRFLVA